MNKEIPNNIEAEQSVIGAMFLSKYALQKATESLSREIFLLELGCGYTYAGKEVRMGESYCDLLFFNTEFLCYVVIELKTRKILNEVGGIEYLTEILDITPTAGNVDYYIQIVEDKSILRNLMSPRQAIWNACLDEYANGYF